MPREVGQLGLNLKPEHPVLKSMDTSQQLEVNASPNSSAKRLHPEDISVGDSLAVAQISYQYPSFMWCGTELSWNSSDHVVQLTFLPADFELLFVKSICIPFVFCKTTAGKHKVIDVRQVELARLDPSFALQVQKGLTDDDSGKSKKRKRKDKKKKRK